ncbi:hypothetical protein BKA70DRAFT_1157014 [Coprinopsis sp. MPI-PUGE-AT-0042]|nr:hypothetical protein BKA70DRAFT_1157014 [Coprinopsis sp. MPI-PUGE-AT-0042]
MMASKDQTLDIRITSHGKIKTFVSSALNHLQKSGTIPVVLHTLPSSQTQAPKTGESLTKLPTSVAVVPRLLTVVEIIKREFMKRLAEEKSARMKGLHQYNEVGILEDLPVEEEDGDAMAVEGNEENGEEKARKRSEQIVQLLSGNHVKQIQTPYMRVTLSLYEVPGLVARGATYQPPKTRKISKAAKSRARKGARKEEAGAGEASAGAPE